LASTTPPSQAAATIVVPCGSGPAAPPAAGRTRSDPPGSISGACDDRNSLNDPAPISSRDTRRPHRSRYIPRLLGPAAGLRLLSPPYVLAGLPRERARPDRVAAWNQVIGHAHDPRTRRRIAARGTV